MDPIELFFKAHQYTVAAFSAASTFTAVLVSLALAVSAKRSNRTRLRANASFSIIMHATIDPKNPPRYLTVSVTNVGIMPLRIPFAFFHWHVRLRRGTFMVTPHDYSARDPHVPQQQYPVEIAPRASHSFFLSEARMFRKEMRRIMSGPYAVGRLGLFLMHAIIVSDDGQRFHVKLDKSVCKELRAIRKAA